MVRPPPHSHHIALLVLLYLPSKCLLVFFMVVARVNTQRNIIAVVKVKIQITPGPATAATLENVGVRVVKGCVVCQRALLHDMHRHCIPRSFVWSNQLPDWKAKDAFGGFL